MTHAPLGGAPSTAMLLRILRAIGVFTAASAAVACGGNVTVDVPAGVGGGRTGGGGSDTSSSGGDPTTTTTTTTTTTATTTTTTTTATGPQPVCQAPAGAELRYLCQPGSSGVGCPPLEAVAQELMQQVEGTRECVGSGTCCNLASGGCGPDPSATTSCCYHVAIEFYGCEGRPFTVAGIARTASIAKRDDWLDAVTPDLEGLDQATRSDLAERFVRAGLFEHASVASFARFALDLLAIGAPPELLAAAQAAMGDEIRHARLCFALASAYAATPLGPSRLAIDQSIEPARTTADVAAATVVEGCINETIAAMIAEEEAARATDPAVQRVLTSIAADEASHAELAWRTVAWALEEGDTTVRQAVERAFRGARLSDPHAEEQGTLASSDRRSLVDRAFAEVVTPSARALLAKDNARRLRAVGA